MIRLITAIAFAAFPGSVGYLVGSEVAGLFGGIILAISGAIIGFCMIYIGLQPKGEVKE